MDAVNLIVDVDGERHSIQALTADAAPEAARVVRFAHRLQDLRETVLS